MKTAVSRNLFFAYHGEDKKHFVNFANIGLRQIEKAEIERAQQLISKMVLHGNIRLATLSGLPGFSPFHQNF